MQKIMPFQTKIAHNGQLYAAFASLVLRLRQGLQMTVYSVLAAAFFVC
jgi:hypothetical protein